MEDEKVIPTVQELAGFDLNDPSVIELIHQAQESDAADRELTIKQALMKYKKAVFWAMLLSTSLVMEGYDLVIVSPLSGVLWIMDAPKYPSILTSNIDHFFLRPTTIPKSFWNIQRVSRT